MKKQIFALISVMCLLIIIPHSYAQEIQKGSPVMYELEFVLAKSPDVKVIFNIQNFMGISHLEILGDKYEDLNVYTEKFESVEYKLDGNTFADSKYIIFSDHPKFGEYDGDDLFVEYKIHDYIKLKDKLWTAEFSFPHPIIIDLYDHNDWVFLNSNAVLLPSNAGKINCAGVNCDLTVEFFNDEQLFTRTQSVSLNEKSVDIPIMSNGFVSDFDFDESLKLISFSLEKENQIVVMSIPFELLLNPYRVYLTDLDALELDPYDQIKKGETSGGHSDLSILSFRPSETGKIYIQGATEAEHIAYAESKKPDPVASPTPQQQPPKQTNQMPDTSILHSPENVEDLTWSEIKAIQGIGEEETNPNPYFYLVPIAMITIAVVFGISLSIRKKISQRLNNKNRR